MRKRPINKFWIILLAIATTVAVLLSVMTYFSTTSAVMPNIAGIIAQPFRSASAAISETVGKWNGYLTGYDALKAENEALKKRIAEMEADNRQAVADREENARLRALADLREQRRELSFESARILVQDASNWSSMLTINKGTMHEIEVGDCVVNEEGALIGVVTEAGLTWSNVRTILDSESSIGALVFRSGASAVAQGDFSLMREGRLTLTYLGTDPDLVSGDLIVTSGLRDYYPSQLVIGYVEEVRPGDDGMSQIAVVRPEVDMHSLVQVFVVKDFDIVD
ncbi:MAG: rod shape-determining protein MreC [Oscillospiraceae bacterium]|jgi:rod shape-determining protein MreC|nr:rod shape-determining protein MreC [Oscillospiraceae bacterium]